MQNNVIQYLKQGALVHSPDKVAVADHEYEFTFAPGLIREEEQMFK